MKHNKRFVMVDSDSAEDSESNRPPTHEEISVAAHEIYEEEGCPPDLLTRIGIQRRPAC